VANLADRLKKALIGPVKKAIENFNKQINKGTMKELTDEVTAQIKRGISPVDGAGKFRKYSDSYLEAIKKGSGEAEQKRGKRSPVDMTLTGKMLDSLEVTQRGNSHFMEFEDPKAYFHNNSGAGKSRTIRRLLPDKDGEKFNTVLQRKFVAAIRRIVKSTRIK
jgi:hypothetical protein